jgi:hypothetical protein
MVVILMNSEHLPRCKICKTPLKRQPGHHLTTAHERKNKKDITGPEILLEDEWYCTKCQPEYELEDD